MIQRRVFTDGGELIREGLAPKDVPNTRKDLMAWWAKEDQRIAAEEAAAAAAAAAEAAAPPEPTTEDQLVELADRVGALQAELAETRERLKALDQLELASPESIAACAMAAAMAAGSAEATITAGQKARDELQATADAADARLQTLEGQVGETAAAVGQLLADGRQRLDQVGAEMLAKTTSAISKRIAGLEVQAAQLRGPTGARGRVGQGLIAGAGKRPEKRPDGQDWAPGDSWLDTKAEGFLLSYMDAAGEWSKPTRLVPAPKLINATANVLDMAPRNTILVSNNIKFPGGGGGGGSAPILETEVTVGRTGWVPLFRAWDAVIPSKYWGGRKGTQGYEDADASWDLLPDEIYSWRIVVMLNDPAEPGTAVSATFTVLRQGNGALSLAPHDTTAAGAFFTQGTCGVSDVKIDELNRDFSAESGGRVTRITGEEVSLMFTDWTLTPRTMLISGHAMPIRRRRTDNP
jgi:hypothetical protein